MRNKENSFKNSSPELHFLIAVTTSFYEQNVSTCTGFIQVCKIQGLLKVIYGFQRLHVYVKYIFTHKLLLWKC